MVVVVTIVAIMVTIIYGGSDDSNQVDQKLLIRNAMDPPNTDELAELPNWEAPSRHAEDVAFLNQHPEQLLCNCVVLV